MAGAHAPNAALARAADSMPTSVFELFASRHHALLIFTYREDEGVRALRAAAERYDRVVDGYVVARDGSAPGAHMVDPTGSAFHAYGAEGEPQYVLVRPDGYVAARGSVRDAAILGAYLDHTFGRAGVVEWGP